IPVGTDNCPGEAIILTAGLGSGEFFPVGITTETYSVTDMAGNSASRSFTVTVVDTILPVITLNGEAAVTLECGVDTYTEVGAVATDACCPGALIIAGDAVDVSATGTYVVTYNAQDCNGNSAVEVDRTVHVVDTLNPTIVGCPANIEINNDLGQCGALVTWDEPSTSDECCLAAFTSNHHPGDFFPVGTTTVLYAANDCNGLASTCSFEITVVDTEPPTTVFVTTPSDPDNNPQPFFEWTGSDNNACTPSLQLMYSTQLDGTGWNGWFADTSATIGPLSEGWHIYEVRAMDQAGNIESTATYTWFVDLTAPTVLIHMPENNQEYSLSSVVAASWKTSDGESGLAIVTYTAENGDPIDTSTPGTHSFFVEAWDIAENSTRVDIGYRAVYSVIPEGSAGGGGATGGERGFLDHQIAGGGGLVGRVPLAAVYTLGEYINVGFTLSDDSGQLMSDAVVSLTIMYLVLAEGGEEYDILSIDVIPYDPELGMYALSVATVSGELAFEPGYYDLWIGFDDGTQELMRIQVVSPEE
ncbi:DUF5011 domain-containing protein, partial [Candidatus Bipolaricaulota bacterium]|nr:DUF5011 domain-containing protein [Candidatus Bipolaricaulota bacterium]